MLLCAVSIILIAHKDYLTTLTRAVGLTRSFGKLQFA